MSGNSKRCSVAPYVHLMLHRPFSHVINSNHFSIVFWFFSEITIGFDLFPKIYICYSLCQWYPIFVGPIISCTSLCHVFIILPMRLRAHLWSYYFGFQPNPYPVFRSLEKRGCRKWAAGQTICSGFWPVSGQNIIKLCGYKASWKFSVKTYSTIYWFFWQKLKHLTILIKS